jgi:hypothetical protein
VGLDEAERRRYYIVELMTLKAQTIFKLKLLKLNEQELDKICVKVMNGNQATVKKIIYTYIVNHTARKAHINFFELFERKSSTRFLKKLSLEQLKEMVAVELNRILRMEFKRKKHSVVFQRIVDNAIDCCSNSPMDIVRDNIPQWIHSEYKVFVKKKGKILDVDAMYRGNLIDMRIETANIVKDVFELVDHLHYLDYLRNQLVTKVEEPVKPSGMVDAFELAYYYKRVQEYKNWINAQNELDKYLDIFQNWLDQSEVPKDIKKELRENNYEIHDKSITLWLNKVRKQFEAFVLEQKFGHVSDRFWNKQGKLIRSPQIILEYIEENPAINLNDFLFNCIKVSKQRFPSVLRKMENSKNVKIIKWGKAKDKFYIVYDYMAPKEWFDEKFIQNVEHKLDEKDLYIDEEVNVDYMFPYHTTRAGFTGEYNYTTTNKEGKKVEKTKRIFYSYNSVQQRFAQNFRIFCQKNNIPGISNRMYDIENNQEQKTIVNTYHIYPPQKSRPNKSNKIQREQKRGEYRKIWSSLHNKYKELKNGSFQGGNIIRECMYETGDEDMDFFIADIDARCQILEAYVKVDNPLVKNYFFSEFFKVVKEYYHESNARHRLVKFLRKRKGQYFVLKSELLQVINKRKKLEQEAKKHHGNSKKGKKIRKLLNRLDVDDDILNEANKQIWRYRQLIRELRTGQLVSMDFFQQIIFDACDNYTETRFYRRINIHRDIVSYAMVMANNMHVQEVAKVYKKNDDEFIHKFYNQFGETPELEIRDKKFTGEIRSEFLKQTIYDEYRIVVNEYPNTEPKLDQLLRLLLKVAIKIKAKDIFDEIFDLLYELELEDKERKLLT